jgi:hypothetical protein
MMNGGYGVQGPLSDSDMLRNSHLKPHFKDTESKAGKSCCKLFYEASQPGIGVFSTIKKNLCVCGEVAQTMNTHVSKLSKCKNDKKKKSVRHQTFN